MKITFYGGARSVTGANYLLEHGTTKMLVDCGLNQGTKYAEDLNYQDFVYDPATINAVFITHSHIDHIGRLPKLHRDGFRGKVYTTTATRDLMAVALPDNMSHITSEAKQDNHDPLFEDNDLTGIISLVEGIYYKQPIQIDDDIVVTFHDAGHILGSAIIEVEWSDNGHTKKIFFSGDLGNPPTPLLRRTEFIRDADYIVIESAYGDRVHEPREEQKEKLANIIQATIARKGVLMIPSFAVERTQELLYQIDQLSHDKKIPRTPTFIDSPLAIKMTGVFRQHSEYFNKETMYLINSGDDIFNFPGLQMTATTQESKMINDVPAPKIIIAGSGMSQGGRILHHEVRYLSDPNSTILFVGYQVDGSLGRRIQRGDAEVRVLGQTVEVKCHRETISSFSAHADQPQLLNWVKKAKMDSENEDILKKVFVVQGEEQSSKTLAGLIKEEVCVDALAPVLGDSMEL